MVPNPNNFIAAAKSKDSKGWSREHKKRTVKDDFQDSILMEDDEVRSTKDRRS